MPRIADVYAAIPSMTGKMELEYEGEQLGANRIARDLIKRAAGEIFEGYFVGIDFARNKNGKPSAVGWGTYQFIENAISVMQDGSIENISKRVGDEHKVRSFFNNISNPWNPNAVTIDTHAVAAAHLEPAEANPSGRAQTVRRACRCPSRCTRTAPMSISFSRPARSLSSVRS